MAQKFKTKAEELAHEEQYLEFLKKRLSSENFKRNVLPEIFAKTQKDYDKAKLRVRLLKMAK